MPKITTMQMAIHAATEWVSRYHPFREVRGSRKDAARGVWCVEFAVGPDAKGRATVCLEAETGEVVEYQTAP